MLIRRRYSRTKMASHRRRFLPHWVIYSQYIAFTDRLKWGRYPSIYYWHKGLKKIDLSEKTIVEAISKFHTIRNVR